MKIFEVANPNSAVPDPDELMGLVSFLDGRADDQNAQKEISQDAFIRLAQSLGIIITKENLPEILNLPPLSNLLEPVDPGSDMLKFKNAGQPDVAMPVNQAQDIVANAAKSAMNKDRGV